MKPSQDSDSRPARLPLDKPSGLSSERSASPLSRAALWVRRSAVERSSAVTSLALPAVGEQVLNMTVGLFDTWLVGHLGAEATAAVSIANQFVMMATVLFAAVATGSTALIARSVGADDYKTANRAVNQSLLVGTFIGLLSTALGVLLARQAVQLMGATDESLPLATNYLRIVAYTFLLSTWLFIGNACLRGTGDTMSTMRIMTLVNVVNIGVSWALVYGPLGLPKMGVAGAAIGTAAARVVGGCVVLFLLLRGRGGLRLNLRQMAHFDGQTIRRILQIGVPTGIEQMLMRLGQSSYLRIVTSLGMTACAAHSVALNAESLSYMPGFGFAVAATALVGQGLGAGEPKRAETDGYLSYALGASLMAFMGVVFFLFSPQIVGFFTSDPDIIALGSGPLRLVAIAQPMLASNMIFGGALRGAGDTRWPMVSTAVGVWLVRVPLAILFVLVLRWGLMGAWYAMIIDLAFRGTLVFTRFRLGRWKSVEV